MAFRYAYFSEAMESTQKMAPNFHDGSPNSSVLIKQSVHAKDSLVQTRGAASLYP